MHLSHSRLATTITVGLLVLAACTSTATEAPVVTAAPPTSPTSTPPATTALPTSPPPATSAPSFPAPGSLVPVSADHADPALEALLPDNVDGIALTKQSLTAPQIVERPDPRLVSLGKEPADLTIALAGAYTGDRIITILAERLDGVSGDQLLAATLESMPGAPVSQTSLGGREVTFVTGGRLATWYYATDELLFQIQATGEDPGEGILADEETAARILAVLP